MTVTTKQCQQCPATFTVTPRQHMKLYCSDRCRWAANYVARCARGEQRRTQPSRIRAYRRFADAFDRWLVQSPLRAEAEWEALIAARDEVRLFDV